jgi:glucosyl-3-phosphoglycerate phosphatase
MDKVESVNKSRFTGSIGYDSFQIHETLNLKQKIINLKNNYFIMRHGESTANTKKLIVSNPEKGMIEYGLTENGRNQVIESIQEFSELDSYTIIYSSDFLRTKQTSEIARLILNSNSLILTEKLRERFFGSYDMTGNENYEKVWAEDLNDPDQKNNNVESVNEVLSRMFSQIIEIDPEYEGKNILIVSHGDPLQILLTKFNGIGTSEHRNIKHLEPAEIRRLNNNMEKYHDIKK